MTACRLIELLIEAMRDDGPNPMRQKVEIAANGIDMEDFDLIMNLGGEEWDCSRHEHIVQDRNHDQLVFYEGRGHLHGVQFVITSKSYAIRSYESNGGEMVQ